MRLFNFGLLWNSSHQDDRADIGSCPVMGMAVPSFHPGQAAHSSLETRCEALSCLAGPSLRFCLDNDYAMFRVFQA